MFTLQNNNTLPFCLTSFPTLIFSFPFSSSSILTSSLPSSFTQIDRTGLKTLVDVNQPSCVSMSDLSTNRDDADLLQSSTNCNAMKAYRCLSTLCSNCIFSIYRDLEPSKERKRKRRGRGKGNESGRLRTV